MDSGSNLKHQLKVCVDLAIYVKFGFKIAENKEE